MSDYIKREDALAICQKAYEERLRMQDYCGDTVAWNIGADIKLLPAVDVTPVVRGEWVDTPNGTETICSYCKADWNVFDNDTYRFNYCPNCGAKMEYEEDNL